MAKIAIGDYSIAISREGVKVGCTFVPRKTLEQILAAIKKAKPTPRPLREGTRVKVVRVVEDSACVLNRTGYVVCPQLESNQSLVHSPSWTGGHSEGMHRWYVDPEALKVIRK